MEKLLLFKTAGNNFGLNTRTSTMPLAGEKNYSDGTSDTLSPIKLQTPGTGQNKGKMVFDFQPGTLEEMDEATPVDNQDMKKFKLPEAAYLTDDSESPEEKKYKELLIAGVSKKFKTMDNKSPNAIKGDDDAAEIEDFPEDIEVLSPTKKASLFAKYKANEINEEDEAKLKAAASTENKAPRETTPENQKKKKDNSKDLKKDPKTRIVSKDVVSSDVDIKRVMKKQEQRLGTMHPFRHLIFSPTINEQTFKRHLTLTYRGLVYSSKCLKGPSDKFIKAKQVNLVDSKVPRFKTLLFDLDETLIHSCNLKENPQHIVKAYDDCGGETTIGINIRPFLMETLDALSQYYEIFIFTASSSNYANAIINFIDPYNKYINGILTRSNCMETKNGFFIKDLRIIRNRELKHIIIVDNLAHSFGFQIENGIPILEFHDDKKDTELKFLTDYLIQAAFVDDVREFNKKKLKLHELAQMKIEDLGV